MVISDLHIGFESYIYSRGITFDEEIFFDEIIRELSDLIKSNRVEAQSGGQSVNKSGKKSLSF